MPRVRKKDTTCLICYYSSLRFSLFSCYSNKERKKENKLMSTMISSQGMAFATAMAVSGTVILLAIRLQKSLPPTTTTTAAQFSLHQTPSPTTTTLRSCISSDGKKIKKKKKRVHFAKDVMDSCGDGEEFRRQHLQLQQQQQSKEEVRNGGTSKNRGMPANRAALYNGILRDRVNHRLAYSC